MKLSETKIGDTAVVVGLEESGPNTLRLMEMGIVPGVQISVIKSAPLGDPLEIRVRGYNLAIRKKDADSILISETGAE